MSQSAAIANHHISDEARRRLVTCLESFQTTIAAVLPYEREEAIDLLDLGGGSGILSGFMLERFSNAHITLIDSSEEAIESARGATNQFGDRIEFLVRDFAREELPIGYHAVISALAIHNLDNIETRGLYRSIYSSLHPGGMLVVADRLAAPSPILAERYRAAWLDGARTLGASDEEISEAEARQLSDNRTPALEHLQWMVNAGFRDVDVFYKNLMYSVHGGRRPRL
jgi:tRNA (cmo5U34)-methyltransferase